ncbi:MAG TPA: cytochrome P450 [Anaerolineae bacterium]
MTLDTNETLSLSQIMRPEIRANPYPFYAQMRSQAPVHWDETMGFWVLTRYTDVAFAFGDARFSRAQGLKQGFKRLPESDQQVAEPVYDAFSKMMTYADPPYHTRLRGLVSKAFTPRMIEHLRPRIQQLVDKLLDAAEAKGQIDVIDELAYPLPIIVIIEMLGLALEERQHFKEWSDDLFAILGLVRHSPDLIKKAVQSLSEMTDHIVALGKERISQPQEDLLTGLVTVMEAGDRLSEDELVANIGLILGAGHETTTNLIGNGLLALLRHPDQMQKLREDPALAPGAVEEMLRYDNPAQIVYRSVTEEIELSGQWIGQGQLVNLIIGAANRDSAQFSDPDRFDITRHEGRQLGLGLGIHFCLGAALARLEGELVFNSLLRRFPAMQLATDTLEWQTHPTFRGLKALPVAF